MRTFRNLLLVCLFAFGAALSSEVLANQTNEADTDLRQQYLQILNEHRSNDSGSNEPYSPFALAIESMIHDLNSTDQSRSAEQVYLWAIDDSERLGGPFSVTLLELLNSYYSLLNGEFRFLEAEPILSRLIQIQQRADDQEDERFAWGENALELVGILQLLGRPTEAEAWSLTIIEAFTRREQTPCGQGGMTDRPCYFAEAIGAMALLAQIYLAQGRWTEADYYFQLGCRAEFYEGGALPGQPDTPSDCQNPRELAARGLSQDALAVARRAVGRAERDIFNAASDTPILWGIPAIETLGSLYEQMERLLEAEALYERTLTFGDRYLARRLNSNIESYRILEGQLLSAGQDPEPVRASIRDLEAGDTRGYYGHLYGLRATHWALARFGVDYSVLNRELALDHTTGSNVQDLLGILGIRDRLGLLFQEQGRWDAAQAQFEQSLRDSEAAFAGRILQRQSVGNPVSLVFRVRLASLNAARGDYELARRQYAAILEAARSELGSGNPLTVSILRELAATFVTTEGNLNIAVDASRELVSIIGREQQRRPIRSSAIESPTIIGRSIADDYLLHAAALWELSNSVPAENQHDVTDEAFQSLQAALASPATQAVANMAIQREASQISSELANLVRERDRLATYAESLNLRILSFQSNLDQNQDGPGEDLVLAYASAGSRINEIDTILRQDFPDYFGLVRPGMLDLAAAQAMLGADEAALLIVPSEHGTHVIAVSAHGVQWHRSDWADGRIGLAINRLRWDLGAISEASAELRAEWNADHVPGTPYGFNRTTAFALYQQLIEPVQSLLEGSRQVFVVSGGRLSGLPFSVLVTEPPEGPDNDPDALRGTAWMAERYALTHVPSIQSLQLLRNAQQQRRGNLEFAGFGDPVLSGSAQRRGARNAVSVSADSVLDWVQNASSGRMADVESLWQLARLPGTAIELENMRQALGADQARVWLGDRATERAVRTADLSTSRIIAFATHGLMPNELSNLSEPGLVFTPPIEATDEDDGYLAASEVSALRLNADWVILSACNTATSDEGSGLSSLARSFFYAGARNLLASHWQVDDEVASQITVRTIEILRDESTLTRAQAFQRAMEEIRMDASYDSSAGSWAHPQYWAPFVLIGGS